MNNLTTRKIVIGLLVTLVLAFGVQGIADAADLPLSKTSGDLQTKSVDEQFEISFSVGIRSNTTAIRNSDNKLITDGTVGGVGRIDSQGYLVTPKDGQDRRNTTVVMSTLQVRAPASHSDNIRARRGSDYIAPDSAAIFADSSKYAYDNDGLPLYYYRDAADGIDDNSDGDFNDAGDTRPVTAAAGSRVRILQEEFVVQVSDSQRYHYNQEAIEIKVGKDGNSPVEPALATMTFKLKASGFQRPITGLAEVPGSDPNGLPRSVTLICTPSTAGTYKVRITDMTLAADTPWDPAPVLRAYIEFTLYVVAEAVLTIAPAGGDDDKFHAGETLRIDDDFTVSDGGENALIHYEVLSGPGTVFERTSPDDTTTPAKSHLTSNSAHVYLILNNGNSVVRATISGDEPVRDGVEITYTYTGTGARRTPTPTTTTTTTTSQTGSLTIVVTGTGATRSVTVNAVSAAGTPTAIPAVLTGTATSTQTIITGTATEITLPTAPGSYTLTATASVAGYNPDTETITVAAPALGTLSITAIGTPDAGSQTFSISAVDADGDRAIGDFTARLSGTGFTSRDVEIANGRGNARVTLPIAGGLHTLTARATGYTDGSTTVRIAGTGQQQQQQQPAQQQPAQQQPTVSEPDSVSIVGPSQRDGTANTVLDAALIVEVVDDDGDAVADARVIFRVRTGQGRLSERGNGRAIAVQTNSSGHARATYTPISASSTVEAEARGVTRRVTFTITVSGGSAGPVSRDVDGTPSGDISPVVHVGAAQRPPMLWVDGGAIYALVGADVKEFAPSVDNALNIAVGGGKVYWTEKTGESGGTINSANLNGSGVTELASIMAVPMGIAVDTAGSKLYWTNSRGRIQSANLDGSGITNVMQDLPSPMDIALAGGNAYWTQGGNVRFVNLRGTKQIRNVSTGTDAAGSLVIGGGKVYWTEKTGESGGTVNSANLNGTGAAQLASILAAPIGIAVDGSRSKLYWTNARGRIQSANLDGSKITNVVSGLGSPGELVLSNSIATPTAATTTTRTTTTASRSKYDVNGDGTVDNTDASLVSTAMGTSTAKYDVNGDGTVNFLDLLLVFDNRDDNAAGAPTIVGMKMSAAQIDIIKEQIDLLIATNDRSPAALRTLIYLQQLLVTARPEKTQLLANYPNPFNPETWIPYELATDTDVRLTIYNTQGVVIRSLEFGHQSAGYYTGRDRAAYWDGRNALGEQVASGLYFYQLETDEMSLMRKMVILK